MRKVEGSRTASEDDAGQPRTFDLRAKGKKNATPRPQARLVALQFALTRITYRCDIVPVTQSELSVAEQLLNRFAQYNFHPEVTDEGLMLMPVWALEAQRL